MVISALALLFLIGIFNTVQSVFQWSEKWFGLLLAFACSGAWWYCFQDKPIEPLWPRLATATFANGLFLYMTAFGVQKMLIAPKDPPTVSGKPPSVPLSGERLTWRSPW